MDIQNKELHRIVTTVIIYNEEGKFLITKRSLNKKQHPGRWTVPGGGLSVDDYIDTPKTIANGWSYSLTNTARREVKEEVGIEIGKPEYLRDLTFIRVDGIPVLVLSYFAEYISGDVILDEDTMDFAWVTSEELKNYDLIDGIGDEIREVEEILKKRKIG